MARSAPAPLTGYGRGGTAESKWQLLKCAQFGLKLSLIVSVLIHPLPLLWFSAPLSKHIADCPLQTAAVLSNGGRLEVTPAKIQQSTALKAKSTLSCTQV